MNCHYSILVEGLNNGYSEDSKKRDLQLEAKAHIDVQRWINGGHPKG